LQRKDQKSVNSDPEGRKGDAKQYHGYARALCSLDVAWQNPLDLLNAVSGDQRKFPFFLRVITTGYGIDT